MFKLCCTLLYVHSSIAIILMGKRELVALLKLSSWCLVMVERLFLTVPRGCLQFVIVVFPDHTLLLFLLYLAEVHPTLNLNFHIKLLKLHVSIVEFYQQPYRASFVSRQRLSYFKPGPSNKLFVFYSSIGSNS